MSLNLKVCKWWMETDPGWSPGLVPSSTLNLNALNNKWYYNF